MRSLLTDLYALLLVDGQQAEVFFRPVVLWFSYLAVCQIPSDWSVCSAIQLVHADGMVNCGSCYRHTGTYVMMSMWPTPVGILPKCERKYYFHQPMLTFADADMQDQLLNGLNICLSSLLAKCCWPPPLASDPHAKHKPHKRPRADADADAPEGQSEAPLEDLQSPGSASAEQGTWDGFDAAGPVVRFA